METQTPPLEVYETDLLETRNVQTVEQIRTQTAEDDSPAIKNRPNFTLASGSASDEAPGEGFDTQEGGSRLQTQAARNEKEVKLTTDSKGINNLPMTAQNNGNANRKNLEASQN